MGLGYKRPTWSNDSIISEKRRLWLIFPRISVLTTQVPLVFFFIPNYHHSRILGLSTSTLSIGIVSVIPLLIALFFLIISSLLIWLLKAIRKKNMDSFTERKYSESFIHITNWRTIGKNLILYETSSYFFINLYKWHFYGNTIFYVI